MDNDGPVVKGEVTFEGVNVFAPVTLENGSRMAVVIEGDTIRGALRRTNGMVTCPWWADEPLKEWLGEPYTSEDADYTRAARGLIDLIALIEERKNDRNRSE